MNDPNVTPGIIRDNSITDYLDRSEIKNFLTEQANSGVDDYLISLTFPVPSFDPLACLEILSTENEFNFYWEKPDQQFAFSGGEAIKVLSSSGPSRFHHVAEQVVQLEESAATYSLIEHSLSGIHLVGGFSFFESIKSPSWQQFGSSSLTVPGWLLIKDGKLGLLTITIKKMKRDDTASLIHKIKEKLSRFDELYQLDDALNFELKNRKNAASPLQQFNHPDYEWMNVVQDAKDLIDKKTFGKIVLAREVTWESESAIAPTHVINKLRNEYPSCYNFLVKSPGGKTFLGSSPERLVLFQKNYLLTESLAGSIPRGDTATEDVYLEKRLFDSIKNRNEHQFVLKAIERRLRPFVKKIDKSSTPEIKKLRNVQHLYTPVRGWLKKDMDRFSILEQLHPTPAVGGYPREKAIPFIEKLESFDRGWYAGPVGWLNLNGGGEFAVAIRSSLIEQNCARVFAGCGIVENSDPYTEWEETNLKLTPMLSALEHDEVRQTE